MNDTIEVMIHENTVATLRETIEALKEARDLYKQEAERAKRQVATLRTRLAGDSTAAVEPEAPATEEKKKKKRSAKAAAAAAESDAPALAVASEVSKHKKKKQAVESEVATDEPAKPQRRKGTCSECSLLIDKGVDHKACREAIRAKKAAAAAAVAAQEVADS